MKLNKPRVTLEGEIVTELEVESSNLGANIDIAGQSLPTFGTRRVTSFIRMREGESLMLAGLLREDQRRALTGFPGLLHTPILRRIFGNTVDQIQQTDIVFLMTPRLVRSSEVTQENLDPIYIGSQQNLGLTGAPPLIATDPGARRAAPPAAGSRRCAARGGSRRQRRWRSRCRRSRHSRRPARSPIGRPSCPPRRCRRRQADGQQAVPVAPAPDAQPPSAAARRRQRRHRRHQRRRRRRRHGSR